MHLYFHFPHCVVTVTCLMCTERAMSSYGDEHNEFSELCLNWLHSCRVEFPSGYERLPAK